MQWNLINITTIHISWYPSMNQQWQPPFHSFLAASWIKIDHLFAPWLCNCSSRLPIHVRTPLTPCTGSNTACQVLCIAFCLSMAQYRVTNGHPALAPTGSLTPADVAGIPGPLWVTINKQMGLNGRRINRSYLLHPPDSLSLRQQQLWQAQLPFNPR